MKHLKTLAKCSVVVIAGIILANYPDEIRTGEVGLLVIGNAEDCYREPYKCPADVWTDGIGNTNDVVLGRKLSDEEIAERWKDNIKIAENCVNRWANGKELSQGAFEAAVSITFNVGCSKLKQATLFKYARMGDINLMCNQFPRWVYSQGKVLPGLVKRRNVEKALCLGLIKSPEQLSAYR